MAELARSYRFLDRPVRNQRLAFQENVTIHRTETSNRFLAKPSE
jgi:hypothetical protein